MSKVRNVVFSFTDTQYEEFYSTLCELGLSEPELMEIVFNLPLSDLEFTISKKLRVFDRTADDYAAVLAYTCEEYLFDLKVKLNKYNFGGNKQ